jgi:quinolinate synthase
MAMNSVRKLIDCLSGDAPPIELDEAVIRSARTCIERMLEFTARHPVTTAPPPDGFVPNIGAA